MTLGFEDSLEYSMATCRSREERLYDFTATCRSREERMKLSTRRGKDCRERMKIETIKAMDPGNEDVIADFMTFVNGKKFYRRIGKTWRRGYFLYEPPGSDGASLIAAMADFLEFNLYDLDLASFCSFSELRNTLRGESWSSSVIAIHDLDDFDHCAGMLPNLKNELQGLCLLDFVNVLLSSCGDEQIIVFTTNNRDRHDAAQRCHFNEDIYVHKSSPQPVALGDEGEIVQLNSSRQKPLVDFEAANINGRVCQSGPIVFNSEKKDTGEGLNRECLTKIALSLDDSTKPRLLPGFDATENKVVKVYTGRGRGCWDSMELEQRTMLEELGMDPENKGIISDLLRFVRDKEELYKDAGKDWKRGYLLYDSLGTDRSSLIAAMVNFLEFDIYHLDLTGLTSMSELTNVLVSIRHGSLIVIKDLDHWAGKLPVFKTELTLSNLLKMIHGLLSICGAKRIIVLNTNHNHIGSVDPALLRSLNIDLYIHTSSPQPKALPDGGEIVLLDPSEQKPSVDFDATNNRAYQSDVLVSNSEEKNTREASRRQCMPESVPSLVDSTTRISVTDFDALDNSVHLVMAYQSGRIVFNLEKKDIGEVLSRECSTKIVLSLDDSSKQKSLSDVAVTGKKSHIVRAYESGPVVSFSDDKSGGEALKRECITIKSILGLEDLQQHSGGRGDDAAKSFCAIYDPGIHTADSLAQISFEVLETLPTWEQPNDCVPLLSLGRLTLEDCVQQEKSPDLPRVTQINGVEQRVTKLPRYSERLTSQSASSSCWPIGLPDRGYIVLLDPLDQSTKHIEYVARADQCSPTLFLAEKKMVRKTLKRKCRTMSVIFENNHQHFARRCEGDAKSLGVKRIKNQGIHQWPFLRQKWVTRKGYSLGEERPFEVRRLSIDETLDSRLQLIHMSQFARSSPQALALPDGGEIVRPTTLSSSEFAAANNRAHLVGQDQSGSTASHYKCKNTRETSDKQGLEHLRQHFGCKHKHALKSLVVSGSMFKSTCKQHLFYWWLGQFENNEQAAFDATSNRAHLVKADERGPTMSNALSLEDLRHHFGARCKESAKGLRDSLAWKSFKVPDSLPLVEQSNTRWRSLTHKHCVRLKKSQDLPQSMLRDCSGGLITQSAIGLPDRGHILSILSLSEKKIVRKTLTRKCRSMSVLSLVDRQQHVDRRWEDAAKNIGAKRICRQLVIHRVSTAKRICRQHGIHHRWPFEQTQGWGTMKGYSLGDERPVEVISLFTHEKLVSRLQLIYISWLGRFLPRPSALAGGGEIGGPIALSLSESAATKNIAHRVGQDPSGPGASDSENERTREQEDPKEIYTSITSDDLRRLYGTMNRKDAAASLGVSIATFKRKCREFGIKRWPHVRKKKVGRPPDQHREGNTSAVNPENGLIIGSSSEWTSQVEAFLMGHVSESSNLAFPAYSDAAAPSQPVATILQTMPMTTHMIPQTGGFSGIFQLEGQLTQSTSRPNPSVVVPQEPQIASTQMLSENMGILEYWEEFLSFEEETSLGGHVSGPVNLSGTTCCDPSPSQQPVLTNRDMMPTTHMMSHLVAREDMRSVTVKISYGDRTIKFQVPLTSRIIEVKEEVKKRLKLEPSNFDFEYKDEDDGDWIFIGCDEDLTNHLQLFSNRVIRLLVVDNDASTKNICESCGSLKRKRQ